MKRSGAIVKREIRTFGGFREDHEEILQQKGTGLEEVYRLYDRFA